MTLPDHINSDTMPREANPYAKKPHNYEEINLFKATNVIRVMGKKTDKLTWEFGNGSGTDLKITREDDYNVFQLLPETIREIPGSQRQPCAVDLFWRWKRAT